MIAEQEMEVSPLDLEHPLRPICSAWMKRIKAAREYKRELFDKWADECMDFYVGDKEAIWKNYMHGSRGVSQEDIEGTTFRFTVMKGTEMVQIFGPHLYNRNPVRTVEPRIFPKFSIELFGDPNNPQVQQQYQQLMQGQQMVQSRAAARAELMRTILNYTPNELDLKRNSRLGVDEALIKGAGVAWTEVDERDDERIIIGSFHDSIDNYFIDPDADNFRSVLFECRRCYAPVWEFAEEYDLDEDYVREKATIRTQGKQASDRSADDQNGKLDVDTQQQGNENQPVTGSNDLVVYYKLWSKMGFGDQLSENKADYRNMLERFGRNVFLVLAEGFDYPANFTSEDFKEWVDLLNRDEEEEIGAAESEARRDELFMQVQWPIPFWLDGRWPSSMLAFHDVPNQLWPQSHLRPGLGELKFMNWALSFLADKVRTTARVIIGSKAHLSDNTKKALESGKPVEVVELTEAEGSLKDNLELFQFKQENMELWQVGQAVNDQFERLTGLNEVMHGMPGGMRSAEEARNKFQAANVRPDDMADRVEDWHTEQARKEALAWIWLGEPEDVAPIVGPVGAMMWERLVSSQDPVEVALELDYRIEAGSARKPNKQQKIENMNQAMTVLMPLAMQYAQAFGDVDMINEIIKRWSDAMDLNPEGLLLKPPPKQEGPSPEEQQMQMEMQMEMQKHQMEQQKTQWEIQLKQIDQQIKQAELQGKQQEIQMKLAEKRTELQAKIQVAQAMLQQKTQEHQAEMAMGSQEHRMAMIAEAQKQGQKLAFDEAAYLQKLKQMKLQQKQAKKGE